MRNLLSEVLLTLLLCYFGILAGSSLRNINKYDSYCEEQCHQQGATGGVVTGFFTFKPLCSCTFYLEPKP